MGTAFSHLPYNPFGDKHWERFVRSLKRCTEISYDSIKRSLEALDSTIDAMKEPLRWLMKKNRFLGNLLLPERFKPEQYESIPPGTALRVKRVVKRIQHAGLVVAPNLVIHVRKDKPEECSYLYRDKDGKTSIDEDGKPLMCCKVAKAKADSRWSGPPSEASVEAMNTNCEAAKDKADPSCSDPPCEDSVKDSNEHGGKGGKGHVMVTCMSCFALGDKVVEIPFGSKHGVSAAIRTMLHGGGKSYWRSSGPVEEVLDRAHEMLVNGLPREYHLMYNNCDTFVYYCKTGRWPAKSFQAMEGWGPWRLGCTFGGLSRLWPTLCSVLILASLVSRGVRLRPLFIAFPVIFSLLYEIVHKVFRRFFYLITEMCTRSPGPSEKNTLAALFSMFV